MELVISTYKYTLGIRYEFKLNKSSNILSAIPTDPSAPKYPIVKIWTLNNYKKKKVCLDLCIQRWRVYKIYTYYIYTQLK